MLFLDPEGGSPNATLVLLLLMLEIGISSLEIPKAFLIRSGAQRNFTHIRAHYIWAVLAQKF